MLLTQNCYFVTVIFISKGFNFVKFCIVGILYFIITKVKAETTLYVSAICSEISVRLKFTCFVTYRYIDRVVSYLFSPKLLDRCQVDSNKKTKFPFKKVYGSFIQASI